MIEIDISTIKMFLLFVGVILILVIVFVIARKIQRELRNRDIVVDKDETQRRWVKIETLLNSDDSSSYTIAIIEADKLFDNVLKSMMIPGNDFGQRLKVICSRYPNINTVWQAHITRNKLVHETDYHLTQDSAKYMIKLFKNGLKELGLM